MSALTGQGADRLLELIEERELSDGEIVQLEIPHGMARVMAKLHELIS